MFLFLALWFMSQRLSFQKHSTVPQVESCFWVFWTSSSGVDACLSSVSAFWNHHSPSTMHNVRLPSHTQAFLHTHTSSSYTSTPVLRLALSRGRSRTLQLMFSKTACLKLMQDVDAALSLELQLLLNLTSYSYPSPSHSIICSYTHTLPYSNFQCPFFQWRFALL